jgi:hypothetical protein
MANHDQPRLPVVMLIYTFWCRCRDPHGPTRSHQDLFLHRPEELKNSSDSSREFSLPTGSSSASPLLKSGNRRLRYREPCVHVLVLFKAPNLDGSMVNTSALRGFPYREIGSYDTPVHLCHKPSNPNSDTMPLVLP